MHVDTSSNRRLDVEEGGLLVTVGLVKGFQDIAIFNPAVDEPIKEVRGVNLTTAEVMAPANVLAGVMVKSLITPHCATVVSKDKVTNKLVDFMMRRTIHSSCQLRSLRLLGMAVTVSPHHHRPPPPTAPTQAVCTSVCVMLGRGCIRQNLPGTVQKYYRISVEYLTLQVLNRFCFDRSFYCRSSPPRAAAAGSGNAAHNARASLKKWAVHIYDKKANFHRDAP